MLQKIMLTAFVIFFLANTDAKTASRFEFNFKNAILDDVTEHLSKNMNLNFVIDPVAKNSSLTIVNSNPVTGAEAYNQFSSALALNSMAISVQEGSYIISQARNIQRNLIEVTTTLPKLKPERMVTYIFTFKNGDAVEFNKQIRLMTSKDGEIYANPTTNQVTISDWASNIHRVHQILVEHDKAAKK